MLGKGGENKKSDYNVNKLSCVCIYYSARAKSKQTSCICSVHSCLSIHINFSTVMYKYYYHSDVIVINFIVIEGVYVG